MSDAEYFSLSFLERAKRLQELAPDWRRPVGWCQQLWIGGELLVLLASSKRRAIHDFIAGTIVVHQAPEGTPPSPEAGEDPPPELDS